MKKALLGYCVYCAFIEIVFFFMFCLKHFILELLAYVYIIFILDFYKRNKNNTIWSYIKRYSVKHKNYSPMHGNGKRESCTSSATTTTLLGPHGCNQRIGSNGALHMYAIPRTISPLMQVKFIDI